MLRDDRRDVAQRLQHGLAFVDRAGPAGNEGQERVAVPILGDERQRRRDLERREPAELLGRVADEFPVEPEHVPRGGELEEHRAAVDRVDRMERGTRTT